MITTVPLDRVTCAGGGTRPLDPSQTFDCAAEPAAVADTHVATQAEGKLESIKRVAITNFCVQFVYSKEARGDSAGYWVEYSRTASGAIPGGLDPGRTRAMADTVLDRIEADLRAVGIDVVPYEELAATICTRNSPRSTTPGSALANTDSKEAKVDQPAQNPFVVGEERRGETTGTTESDMTGASTTTRSTETTRSVSFDEALYYDNAGRMLEAMHRMFMVKVAPAAKP